jgi:macrodomain Ter protein organizer (MatP/YcbG family)
MMEKGTALGYMELGYLADALNEYANNPNEVREWVDNLMNCEEV